MTFNTSVADLIAFAYNVHPNQIIGGPAWLTKDQLDLDGTPDVEGQANLKQIKLLIQSALTDRLKFQFHHDQKVLSVYALRVGKDGPKLTTTTHAPSDPTAFYFRKLGHLTTSNISMEDFCAGMQGSVMDKPVVDHTGLTNRYDFTLNWTPDQSQFAQMGAHIEPITEDPNAPPTLYTALQEQLGLKLEPTKATTDVLAIDQIELPAAN